MRSDDSTYYSYKDDKSIYYQIYKDPISNKYGIKDLNKDITIIKCSFDSISWLGTTNLVVFTLNGKQAFYRIDKLLELRDSCK